MILGIGTDIVKISRFNSWINFSKEQFLTIFTEQELQDIFIKEKLNISVLASRFAAKEAFYKAFSAALVKLDLNKKEFLFLFTCKNIEVIKPEWGVPILKINYSAFEDKLGVKLPKLNVDISISHEKDFAVSFVIISNN
ncbi:holo-ACP synthase [Candidatus Dependentiae bacterium]|nr:holo-ACP synthase [Candidatus Dependentiae bacterium]